MLFSLWASFVIVLMATNTYQQMWLYGDRCEHEDSDDVIEEYAGSAVFSLKLTSPASAGVVHFDRILTEVGVSWNQDAGKIRIMRDGIYSIHWNHVSRSRFAKSELRVDNRTVASIVSDVFPTRQFLIDDASNSGTFLLQKSNELSIFTNETLQPDCFFSGFLIKDVSTSVFYATTRGIEQKSREFFPRYENILLNSNLNFKGDQFVASSAGMYVFSAMSATFDGTFVVNFVKNGVRTKSILSGELQNPTFNPDTGLALQNFRTLSSESLTCVFKLQKGDAIRVEVVFTLFRFGTVHDDIPWIFTGFKYLDTDAVDAPAVAVPFIIQRLCSQTCNPLDGAIVQLDNANNFSPVTRQFITKKEGLYVIAVTCFSDVRSHFEVFVSDKSVTSVINEGPNDVRFWLNGGKRVLVQYMKVGDTVGVNVVSSFGLNVGTLSIWALP